MITVSNLGMQFGGQWLFQHVDLQFLPGNCYGIIGANGAGKSTFLRILTGELDSTTGNISIDADKRVSVLKQNQNAYDDYTILDTVIMGNQHLYQVMKEKDAIYEKEDFTDEDGLRAADLEAGLAGGQVTVVAVGQIDTDLGSSLHLELVHGFASLGHIDLIVALHNDSLLCFLRKKTLSEESVFVSVGVFLPARKTIILFLKGKKRKNWKASGVYN